MEIRFKGKVAIVTGGAFGIGWATAITGYAMAFDGGWVAQ